MFKAVHTEELFRNGTTTIDGDVEDTCSRAFSELFNVASNTSPASIQKAIQAFYQRHPNPTSHAVLNNHLDGTSPSPVSEMEDMAAEASSALDLTDL